MLPDPPGWQAVCRRASANYFALQGVLGALWWVSLFFFPKMRPWFAPGDLLEALVLPDLVVYVLGSFVAAVLARRGNAIAGAMVTGAAAYVSLLLVWASLPGAQGFLGAAVMGASGFAGLIATLLADGRFSYAISFRRAPERSWASAGVRTVLQSVVFWGVLLVAVPVGLHALEGWAGVPTFERSAPRVLAMALFAAASSLNAWAGITLAKNGGGTPLPLDATHRLVIAGPYRWVRNPMAITGLTQGLAVGLWLGSPSTVVYVVLGGLVWNVLVRPLEELDLHQKFGNDFERYRENVWCWWPRTRPSES